MMKERVKYFEPLRLLSAFAVVMLHVGMYDWYEWDIYSSNWHILNFFYCFTRFGVPIFFMISGALFINPNREIKIKDLYRNNIFRLLFIYLLWTLLYGLYRGMIEGLDTFHTIEAIINGQHHLWFLPVLIMMYILSPVLRVVAREKIIFNYLVAICFVATFVIFSIWIMPEVGVFAHLLKNKFPLDYISGELVYFVLGYWLYQYNVPKFIQKISLPVSILCGVLVVWMTAQYSMLIDAPYTLYSYEFILVGMQAIFLFIFFKYYGDELITSNRISGWVTRFSPYLLGVYLVHDGVLTFFRKIGIENDIITPVIAIPVITLFAFIVSVAVVYVLKSIPKVNRYLV